jgi:hypothetical protein
MKKNIKTLTTLLVLAFLPFSSCKKDKDVTPSTSDSNVKTESKTESLVLIEADINTIDDDIAAADQFAVSGSSRIAAQCFTVQTQKDTLNPVPGFENNYRKFTISYTGGDCDSLTRKGSLTIYRSGTYIIGNYKDSVVFTNYSTNGRSLQGYRTYKLDSRGLLDISVSYTVNIEATLDSGNFIHYKSVGTKKLSNYLLNSLSTLTITGSTNIVDQNGDILQVSIDSPIILSRACLSKFRFPIEGVVTYLNSRSGNSYVVNYGAGNCDRVVTITNKAGVVRTIYLK